MRAGPLAELFKSTATAEDELGRKQPGEAAEKADARRVERVPAEPLPTARELHDRWRRTALAVVGIATLELALFVAVAVIVLTRPPARTAKAAASPRVARTVVTSSARGRPRRARRERPEPPLLSRAQTRVLVLNANGISGAAANAAAIVRARGYPVPGVADARRYGYARSVVMYKPGFANEASRLGNDLSVPTRQPIDHTVVPAEAPTPLVLVVGRERH
jgi:hypothetical protein